MKKHIVFSGLYSAKMVQVENDPHKNRNMKLSIFFMLMLILSKLMLLSSFYENRSTQKYSLWMR